MTIPKLTTLAVDNCVVSKMTIPKLTTLAVDNCVVCFELTSHTIGAWNVPEPFRMHMCDECYYDADDGALLPVPLSCLFWDKTWDLLS